MDTGNELLTSAERAEAIAKMAVAPAPAAPPAPVTEEKPAPAPEPAQPAEPAPPAPATVADLEQLQASTMKALEELTSKMVEQKRDEGNEEPEKSLVERLAAESPELRELGERYLKTESDLKVLQQREAAREAATLETQAESQLVQEVTALVTEFPGLNEEDARKTLAWIGDRKNEALAGVLTVREVAGRVLGHAYLEERRAPGKQPAAGDTPPPPPPAPQSARIIEQSAPGGSAPTPAPTPSSGTGGISQAVAEILKTDRDKIGRYVP